MVQNVYFIACLVSSLAKINCMFFPDLGATKNHCFQMFAWILELCWTIVGCNIPWSKDFCWNPLILLMKENGWNYYPPPRMPLVTTRILMPFLYSRESRPKPSFVTGILGGLEEWTPNYQLKGPFSTGYKLAVTVAGLENPPNFGWYLPAKSGFFHGSVSLHEDRWVMNDTSMFRWPKMKFLAPPQPKAIFVWNN